MFAVSRAEAHQRSNTGDLVKVLLKEASGKLVSRRTETLHEAETLGLVIVRVTVAPID